MRVLNPSSRRLAPGDESDEHHDNGNRQQDMDEPAHRVTAQQSKQPQHQQYYRNCVQHMIFLIFWLFLLHAPYDLGRSFAMGCNPTMPWGVFREERSSRVELITSPHLSATAAPSPASLPAPPVRTADAAGAVGSSCSRIYAGARSVASLQPAVLFRASKPASAKPIQEDLWPLCRWHR